MTPAEPGQAEPTPTPAKRDWIAIMVTALPGIAALIAFSFTYVSVKATENQVQIARQGQNTAEQGQITDRYNAAITNLGSRSIEVRLNLYHIDLSSGDNRLFRTQRIAPKVPLRPRLLQTPRYALT